MSPESWVLSGLQLRTQDAGPSTPMKLAILLSGRGSNFEAIHRAIATGALQARIVCVISNRPGAPGIERARALGLSAHVFDHKTELLSARMFRFDDAEVFSRYQRIESQVDEQ